MVEKIGYTRPVTTAKPVRKAGSVASPGFADALAAAEGAGGADATEATSSVAAPAALGGLLGVQEVDEREVKKRRAVRRGRLTLDALSNLRDCLLMGTLPLSTIRVLERLVEQERGLTADPMLQSILDDIEVRAAVEIAKLEVAGLI
ncbi:MAG: flagellar assembly protein FliX [Rickettsiales bacterium]